MFRSNNPTVDLSVICREYFSVKYPSAVSSPTVKVSDTEEPCYTTAREVSFGGERQPRPLGTGFAGTLRVRAVRGFHYES